MKSAPQPIIPAAQGSLPTYPDLQGKVVVVTGGSRGIGATTCQALAEQGAKVAICDRDHGALSTVLALVLPLATDALAIVTDCTDASSLERMHRQVEAQLGPVDALLAFAGGSGEPERSETITEARWRFVVDANLTATFLTLRTLLPDMIERRRGAIVTMASSAGRLPSLASAAYAAAKAGVIMLSKHLANEMGPHGVRINCVAPSAIRTERSERLMTPDQMEQAARLFPLRRVGMPLDVAQASLFLVSDASAWLTGVTLDVAGGRIIV